MSDSGAARVLITGAAGMIGRRLVARLLSVGGFDAIVATDVTESAALPDDPRVSYLPGDLSDPDFVHTLVAGSVDKLGGFGSVFHLAGVVSGTAEREFELGQRVNIGGTTLLLEAVRAAGNVPRLVFTSSLAVFGGELPPVVTDQQRLTPRTSYGMQKATGELLVAEYTRRGWIDGRAVRLPTIAIRPGVPNTAASSFLSSIVREPLAGRAYACPVDETVRSPILSPGRCVRNLLHAHDLPARAWGWDRTVTLPSLDVTVAELVQAVERFGGAEAARLISYQPDPFIADIVAGWPHAMRASRAEELGFTADASVDEIVAAHLDDVRAGW